MWLILLYHSRWLLQCKTGSLNPLLNLVPGQWKWWSVCGDDGGGCRGGIVVAVSAQVFYLRHDLMIFMLHGKITALHD